MNEVTLLGIVLLGAGSLELCSQIQNAADTGNVRGILHLASGNTPGKDGIPAETLKCCRVMLRHAFGSVTEGIHLRTRSDGNLFNIVRLRAKTKVQLRCLHVFLFANDAAVTAHSGEDLQWLMSRFSEACQASGLTISLKKTHFMGLGVNISPDIAISNFKLEVVHDFVYLGSTIFESLSLDTELNKRIGKASTTMSRLTKRVWANNELTECTKIQVYRTCVLSTLLYGIESWTLHTSQERQLNAYHMHCLQHILDITRQDKVTNNSLLGES
ncbi:uncharacterized protein [Procambarus clarkii]|uniref:uncharacterized protein n=1 Tax=Procambarus clarkii TaxID=6728 RepID=UPI003743A53E